MKTRGILPGAGFVRTTVGSGNAAHTLIHDGAPAPADAALMHHLPIERKQQ